MRMGGVRRLTLAPDPASARCYGLNFATGLVTEQRRRSRLTQPPGANRRRQRLHAAGVAVSPAEDVALKNVSFLPTTLPDFAHAPDVPVVRGADGDNRADVEPRSSTTSRWRRPGRPAASLPPTA